MPTDVVMPQMGESIFEGTITKWLKKVGDAVEKDEPLFEISTDKVDAEIPSPVAGILSEIKTPEGTTVTVNTVVAVIGGGGAPQARVAPTQAAGATAVVMPQMGESIFEGTITKWLKKTGDMVEKDEPLFEISTDKVDAEIPSPVAGVLTEIKIPEGATVTVNTVVAVIGGAGAPTAQFVPPQVEIAPPQAKAVAPQQAEQVAQVVDGRRIRSSPLVRKIAKEHNINLALVSGTGSDARISKDDILRYIASPPTAAQGARRGERSAPPQVVAQVPASEVVPLSRMRAIIAQRMVESKQISPHVHTVYKIDMTRIVQLRDQERSGFENRNGVKLTFMPFIAVAVIAAMRKHPIVNASLVENAIHYHANINLGIAVALEWGLIVPVVRQAEQRSFVELARTINDLALRARTKRLNPDEVGGSTFTLTNSGVFGDEFSTPIINQPESAILCISSLNKEPAVLTDANGNDTIAIRSMQHFTLGFDHRLLDGADACKFMLELKRALENWDQEIG